MSAGNRIVWLDIAKGITILLMVMGHTSIPKYCQIGYGHSICHYSFLPRECVPSLKKIV